MKLVVFLFSPEEVIELPKIDEHYQWFVIRKEDVPDFGALSRLLREKHPVVLCTLGDMQEWKPLFQLPYYYRRKWVHAEKLSDITSHLIENCYIHSIKLDKSRNPNSPLFSVITTTFHSGNKLFRPYNSLKAQTYRDWEWIIWDDSKPEHTETFELIQSLARDDIRIQYYRAPQHSGFIGQMKWMSSSLSHGDWLVELDHDDIIVPQLFEWCVNAIQIYPEADFIGSSCVELEEENENPFAYGDHFGLGYGHYQKEWIRGKWHNVCPVLDMNPTTACHIVGVPNHVRIWRRSFYEKIGRHQIDLPVVDDYELLLRTLLEGNWIRIQAPCYFQFRNAGGNNFTFLRNSLIQYLTYKLYELYEPEIEKRWEELGMEADFSTHKVWERKRGFSYKKFIKTYVPNCKVSMTISILIPVEDDVTAEQLINTIRSVKEQRYKFWFLYIVGNNSNTLNRIMDEVREVFDDDLISKIRWWNLSQKKSRQILLNYFHRMLLVTKWVAYAEPGTVWEPSRLMTAMEYLVKKNHVWQEPGKSLSLNHVVHSYDLITKYDDFDEDELGDFLKRSK